ncbi:hypothetical protein C1280_24360 [Gemmata obscuriglobus]|uniref:Uncharacterized protein n=2 Tax=Gemmata obscuriglobus TaxID=114 RepID=A0A2Z3GZ88_9BACT|nr:hypothetical protein C1280_24360 [Gemmata obscuriglobus]
MATAEGGFRLFGTKVPKVSCASGLAVRKMSGETMTEPTMREPEQIRQDAARKLVAVEVSDHFRAVLGCLLNKDWTTPRLVEMVITPDGHLLGRCDGEASFKAFLGASEDLLRNIHGVAPVAELDGDEIGYLVGKVAELKRQR